MKLNRDDVNTWLGTLDAHEVIALWNHWLGGNTGMEIYEFDDPDLFFDDWYDGEFIPKDINDFLEGARHPYLHWGNDWVMCNGFEFESFDNNCLWDYVDRDALIDVILDNPESYGYEYEKGDENNDTD